MRGRTLVVIGMLAGTLGGALGGAAGSGAVAGTPQASGRASAAAPAGDAAAARIPAYTKADLRSPATWRAARARVLRARLAAMPRVTGSTVVMASYLFDDALPIGDVDRDGTADVMSVRFQARTPTVQVMSGRTGRVLWSHADPNGYAAIYIAAPGAAPAVLTLSDSQTGEDALVAGAADDVFTVAGFRADHGTALWSTSITGLLEYDVAGFRAVGLGEFDDVLTRTSSSPYLLLERFSEGDAFVAGGMSISPQVIDAATGMPVSAGQAPASDSFAFASAVGDLNTDGTDDYVIATSGDAAMVEAVSGANGAPLWATSLTSPGGAAFVNFANASPDVTGDHKADLLVGWFDGTRDVVGALSGTAGTSVWTHGGAWATPLGDIDHDGRSDTRVVYFTTSETYAAVTATGRTAWTRAVASPHGQPLAYSFPVGDLNGDGAVDTYLRFSARSKSPDGEVAFELSPAVAAYIIDGRTGRSRHVPDLGIPTGDSMSGHAMAFVQTVKAGHGVRITAFNGATTRAYWHTTLSSPGVTGVVDVSVLPMGGRRGIVELLSGTGTETVAVLDGTRGARRWTSSYPTLRGGIIFVA